MTSDEGALRAVRTQVQFEVAEIAAEIAQAMALNADAQRQVTALQQRCDSAAAELRGAMGRASINPVLIAAMRRVHQLETCALHEWQARLAAAQAREQQARAGLADVRNRERSLERALQAERRRQRLSEQWLDMLETDDLWLQHTMRALS